MAREAPGWLEQWRPGCALALAPADQSLEVERCVGMIPRVASLAA